MKMPINLEMSYGDSMPHMPREEHYPEFQYSGDTPLELPDAGVMKIRFRKVRSSERLEGDGDKEYSCCVEVLAIESVKATKEDAESDLPSKKVGNTEEALDKLMAERQSHNSESEDY